MCLSEKAGAIYFHWWLTITSLFIFYIKKVIICWKLSPILDMYGYIWGIYWIYMGRYISRVIPLSPIFRRGTELGDGRMMVGKESITSRNSSWKGSSRGPGARQKSAQKSMGLVEKCWKSPENLWGKPNFLPVPSGSCRFSPQAPPWSSCLKAAEAIASKDTFAIFYIFLQTSRGIPPP